MKYTFEYFKSEVLEFRRAMGMRAYWIPTDDFLADNEPRIAKALRGFLHVYFNLECTPEQQEKAEILADSTIEEYSRRAALVSAL